MNNEPELKVRKKRHDQNFKRSAVEPWLGSGKSAGMVAGELGINAQTAHGLGSGVQYASLAYRQRLAQAGVVPSMSRKGNCHDNAMPISQNGSMLQPTSVKSPNVMKCVRTPAGEVTWRSPANAG